VARMYARVYRVSRNLRFRLLSMRQPIRYGRLQGLILP